MKFLAPYFRLRRGARAPWAFSSFKGGAALFMLTLSLLLAFYAVALAHEVIPGLCIEDGQDECPFCKLGHGLALVLPVLMCFMILASLRRYVGRQSLCSREIPAFYQLRAPPHPC